MAAVGSPAWTLVAASVAGDLDDAARGGVHDVNVVIVVGSAPAKREERTIRRPGRVDQIPLVRKIEFDGIGTVGVHHIELGDAAAVADVDDGSAGLWIPARGCAGAVGEGKTLRRTAIGVGNEDFGVPEH